MPADIAYLASLISDKSRATMLLELMSGRALTATELASAAQISAQTASSHLSKLVVGEFLMVRKQGRHKYFQLKNVQIAELLETLLCMSADVNNQVRNGQIKTGPVDDRLRKSRICYDHLAGEISVKLFNSLIDRGLVVSDQNHCVLTVSGVEFFQLMHRKVFATAKSNRPLCKACLDWSERKSHLSGRLGKLILTDTLNKGWAIKDLDSRVIQFTGLGQQLFYKKYGVAEDNVINRI